MKKYYINLTEQERSQIIHSLIDKKNALMAQGRYANELSRYAVAARAELLSEARL